MSGSVETHRILIDGNNLLFATHDHAPIAHAGRETLVRIIDHWAQSQDRSITIVFDGAPPNDAMVRQLSKPHVSVQFSRAETADDVIVREIEMGHSPGRLEIVTDDKAIQHEARARRCVSTGCEAFIKRLFAKPKKSETSEARATQTETPALTDDQIRKWLDTFDIDVEDEPFDGFDAMIGH